jgi:hypothetical protein
MAATHRRKKLYTYIYVCVCLLSFDDTHHRDTIEAEKKRNNTTIMTKKRRIQQTL